MLDREGNGRPEHTADQDLPSYRMQHYFSRFFFRGNGARRRLSCPFWGGARVDRVRSVSKRIQVSFIGSQSHPHTYGCMTYAPTGWNMTQHLHASNSATAATADGNEVNVSGRSNLTRPRCADTCAPARTGKSVGKPKRDPSRVTALPLRDARVRRGRRCRRLGVGMHGDAALSF